MNALFLRRNLGWCIGGGMVLKFFWLKARRLAPVGPPPGRNDA